LWSPEWPSGVGPAVDQARRRIRTGRRSRSGRKYGDIFGCTESTIIGQTIYVPTDTKDSNIKMCNQLENELHRQIAKEKKKQ
jgi:hypothetical protein